ncbi:hypothetical protein ABMA27_012307 [Loxostege sticticalis]|uniref:Uncharacterized protein n=1 Tax=Loxostege sticticalis TaxID=481309 RepID=A0ABR3H0U8_LOXSC
MFIISCNFQLDEADRGASDRGTLWFGPRLGKRSLRINNEDNRQTFLRLLEAADALKYYYDQLPFYESQADDPETRVTKKVIFTPKLGRSVDIYPDKRTYENVEFTPRLGRRLPEKLPVTPSDSFKPEMEEIVSRNNYFSPRLGRTVNFSPRLGRELSYGIASLVFIQSHGHVLLATNLEDFRSIAKKFVPDPLVDQIADLAVQYSRLNFEELVEKVKERIRKDFEQTKTTSDKPKKKITREYSEEKLPYVSQFVNDRRKETTKFSRPKVKKQEVPGPTEDNDMTFAKITLKQHDSYEDYVTPEKERNIYASDNEKKEIARIPTTTLKQIPDYTNRETESPMEYAYVDKTEELKENIEEMVGKSEIKVKSDELKAKTEDLWYDDKQTIPTEDFIHTSPSKSKTTKKGKGTMIPKRDFYKMSSPNYLAKVPIVAEKYDFNEPIPERDREPEDLKPLRKLPPVNINGKCLSFLRCFFSALANNSPEAVLG